MEPNTHAEQLNGDRKTKNTIVFTICGITIAFALTVCFLSLDGRPIPEALDRLITYAIGVISGSLIKTSVDRGIETLKDSDGLVPVKTETEPLKVTVDNSEANSDVELEGDYVSSPTEKSTGNSQTQK